MTPLQLVAKRIALYDGVYKRVAEQLAVDPSMVSRVARGLRKSPRIEAALIEELDSIENHLRAEIEAAREAEFSLENAAA